ncbi:MAG: hypothetical protein PVI26_00935 [Chitinispirillia bacterium]|jgi:hypothetical protein
MGKCNNHPNSDTDLICMKDSVFMCDICAKCLHPKDYCKFRASCIIWFMRNNDLDSQEKL